MQALKKVLRYPSSRMTVMMGLRDSVVVGAPPPHTRGHLVVRDPSMNKGCGFNNKEREKMGLSGLLPPVVLSLEKQGELAMRQLRSKSADIEKYIFLQTLQDTNETLYYHLLCNYIRECMPIVYTPVVGEACQTFSHIYRQTVRGLYITLNDKGRICSVIDSWPHKDVKAIVFTDGERILGLGDQGIDGMGISIGKLALYSACGGVDPTQCLPVVLDVGTNNKSKLDCPFYMGLKQERLRGDEYDAFVGEFITAAMDAFGDNVMLQFEDFGNLNAFRLLKQWQDKATCFNDDIQGTATVALSGVLSSERITGIPLQDNKFVFYGAGEAGVGIAELMAYAIHQQTGSPIEECRKQIFLIDSKGLVCKSRMSSLQEHKVHYAHDVPYLPDLVTTVETLKPTALIGVSTIPKSFTEEVVRAMAVNNDRPIIFALSNPTSKADCTPSDAYTWSEGRALYASGSPFDPVNMFGKRFVPGQGNNAYCFPGIGLAAVVGGLQSLTREDMYITAKAVAKMVPQERLEEACLYPSLDNIRSVSLEIAVDLLEAAYKKGTATEPEPEDLRSHIESQMYTPSYGSWTIGISQL